MVNSSNRILGKSNLAPSIWKLEIEAPIVARKAKPGNFVVLRVHEKGERIPLTLNDWNPDAGSICIVFLEMGKTTKLLARLEPGDEILDLVGPLGRPADIGHFGTVVCVAGGVGTALIYPEAKAFKEAGNTVITHIGARSKDLLIFEEELAAISDVCEVATEDGSKGSEGYVTDLLQKLLDSGEKIDRVITVGPVVMMMEVARRTRPHGIKTIASLNPVMVDGVGMCGSCRVVVGGETKFACVEGPEFDAHLVDFNALLTRNKAYYAQEAISMKTLQEVQ